MLKLQLVATCRTGWSPFTTIVTGHNGRPLRTQYPPRPGAEDPPAGRSHELGRTRPACSASV